MLITNAMRTVCLFILKVAFVFPFQLLVKLIRHIKDRRYNVDFDDYPDEDEWIDDEDNEQEIQDELNKYADLPEMPEMCQLFYVDENTSIGVQFVSMCPDETAHIRIIGDTTFSQIYKRRVYREKGHNGERYFKLNNQKYYLKDDRTQPRQPTQAKEGK
jgi:hypothetical protein